MQKIKYLIFPVGFLLLSASFSLKQAQTNDKEFKKAEKYFFEKKFETAEKILLNIVSQRPDHPQATSLLGDVYFAKGNFDKALGYFNQASELNPASHYELFRLGQIHLQLQNTNSAEKAFAQAYEKNSQLHICLYQLGYIALVFQRDKQKTIDHWSNFIVKAPQDYQKEKIEKILSLLKDENFQLPPIGSDLSLEEVLLLGGKKLSADNSKTEDKKEGHETKKNNNQTEGLLDDGEL